MREVLSNQPVARRNTTWVRQAGLRAYEWFPGQRLPMPCLRTVAVCWSRSRLPLRGQRRNYC